MNSRCVVLEPDGNHWSIDLPPEKAGKYFEKPEQDVTMIDNRYGLSLPVYKVVTYVAHQFLDNHGNCYWIYVRNR